MIAQIKKRRWHILFWLVYFVGWSWFSVSQYHEALWEAILVTAAYALGQGPLIYLIAYTWIPRYLRPRKTVNFLWRVLAGLLCTTLFTTIAVHLLLGSRLTLPTTAMAGYVFLGNTYWVILTVVAVTLRDRFRLERERNQTELRFLKSQMNPHFLFNALNSIYVLIRKDPDLAEYTLAGFSDMLRYQLYDCAGDHISIDKEIAYLENYMRLEQLRKGDDLIVEYEKQRSLGHFTLAPLLIFPLIENAFKYVSSYPDRENHENRITIRLTYNEPTFQLEVINTTDGISSRPLHGKNGGIGLENLRRRLTLLYPNRHHLEIKCTDDEYSATLQVQIL